MASAAIDCGIAIIAGLAIFAFMIAVPARITRAVPGPFERLGASIPHLARPFELLDGEWQ
jgi:hypothetical protein